MADLFGMLQAAAGNAGEDIDPNFNQTVLLLHGDGTNGAQNNTFLDSSTNNFTITRNGNTTQGTFSPFSAPNGRFSNFFDGSGDGLTIANDADFDFGTGDFAIECFFYLTGNAAQNFGGNRNAALFTALNTTGTPTGYELVIGGNSTTTGTSIAFANYGGASSSISYTATISQNVFYHFVLSRSGTTTKMYLNGSEVASTTLGNQTITTASNPIYIGRSRFTNYESYFPGYISNVRVVKGSSVTPPAGGSTSPLTAISGTSLLTCQSNRFVDNSTNNFAITRNGDVKVTPFSPFAPTAAYDASVNGGSGYWDGSSDSIVVDSALLDGSTWTVEMWVYATALGAGNKTLLSQYDPVQANRTIIDVRNGLITIFNGAQGANSGSTTMITGQWYHIAFVRNSSTVTGYLNGVQEVQKTNFTGPYSIDTMIGFYPGGSAGESWSGYISNIRFSDTNKTISSVPTALLTTDGNTSALLNFTNAGIFDQTGKNNLETVNAQIDTTVKKYGTGSMEFDGSGDWLLFPSSENFVLGTGDWSVQFWLRVKNLPSGTLDAIFDTRPASTQGIYPNLYIDTDGKIKYWVNSADRITATNALVIDTWYFVSLIKESGNTKLFIDGTQSGSTYSDSNNYIASSLIIGGSYGGGASIAYSLDGFLDDFRWTKGVARDGTVVPTKAFPDL